AKQTDVPASG
ncbi:ribonucleotide reductase, all-alpha domain protein, partial [Vibrio parahaemolyticus EKP-021]